jgi:hypothetical protein
MISSSADVINSQLISPARGPTHALAGYFLPSSMSEQRTDIFITTVTAVSGKNDELAQLRPSN